MNKYIVLLRIYVNLYDFFHIFLLKGNYDNKCGDTHWKAADNKPKTKANLDETGLEIAGCRHGLAQWAVNMYQGEIYGYAHFIQQKRMQPANVKFFWEDVICRYWRWARRNGLLAGCQMKPALSVMHAKAHSWSCQVMSLIRYNMYTYFAYAVCKLF